MTPRPLNAGERAVEDVAWIGHPQRLALSHKAPHENRQHVVGAVAAEDPVGLYAEEFGSLGTETGGKRVGILCQAATTGRLLNRLTHCRRRGVGILVGVELDPAAPLRLLARHIRREGGDVGSDWWRAPAKSGHGTGGIRRCGRIHTEVSRGLRESLGSLPHVRPRFSLPPSPGDQRGGTKVPLSGPARHGSRSAAHAGGRDATPQAERRRCGGGL